MVTDTSGPAAIVNCKIPSIIFAVGLNGGRTYQEDEKIVVKETIFGVKRWRIKKRGKQGRESI